MIPFSNATDESYDQKLIQNFFDGSADALSELIERHQRFIYNVGFKLIGNADDAADLTQEVLIKVVTRLKQYQFKSSFRTWLYRMVINHFLSSKRVKKAEQAVGSFEEFGKFLDTKYNEDDMSIEEQQDHSAEISFVRNKCMASTLLCLDRQQRIIFILGSIFNFKSTTAASLLNISPENFRKQLSRAKADIFQFMDNRCGLIAPSNPCRCSKKTKGFIKDGLVSRQTGRFRESVTDTIISSLDEKNRELDNLMENKYWQLFSGTPYASLANPEKIAKEILSDELVVDLFQLS